MRNRSSSLLAVRLRRESRSDDESRARRAGDLAIKDPAGVSQRLARARSGRPTGITVLIPAPAAALWYAARTSRAIASIGWPAQAPFSGYVSSARDHVAIR